MWSKTLWVQSLAIYPEKVILSKDKLPDGSLLSAGKRSP
jgi:hypothetical protein